MKVTVIGATSWGTTLAIVLGSKGYEVSLLARSKAEATTLQYDRQNKRFLPEVFLPTNIEISSDADLCLKGSRMVILAVPSQTMRSNVRRVKEFISYNTLVVSAAKGLELETNSRMSEVLANELGEDFRRNICALSGPNLAKEVAKGLPSTTVIAARDIETATLAQELLITPFFRVYTNTDIVGVELGGTLKNIIAIGAGISDGLGYGDNSKAAFMTRGLAEMTRLGVAAGANPLTFAGLAGLGDLIATCSSQFSRNRFVGLELAKGRKLAEIQSTMQNVAEGVPTTRATSELSKRMGVELPITELMYEVLFEGLNPREAVSQLMVREAKHEFAGIDITS